MKNRDIQQSIAVFGESGSGKTVMVSSFYGLAQEDSFKKDKPFRIVARNPGQGARLSKTFLGMKDDGITPVRTPANAATSYPFSLMLKQGTHRVLDGRPDIEAMQFTWHDYPGDWFQSDVATPEEHSEKVNMFRNLLGSSVALFLIDGKKLLENKGDEARYLKSVIWNFRNGVLNIKEELLEGRGLLEEFPRIWIFALTKADLFQNFPVEEFRNLVLRTVGDDLSDLRDALAEFVSDPYALSVGEDFLLISSAEFTPDKIKVERRIGLDLLAPIAALVPLRRYAAWAKSQELGRYATNRSADIVARVLLDAKARQERESPQKPSNSKKLKTMGGGAAGEKSNGLVTMVSGILNSNVVQRFIYKFVTPEALEAVWDWARPAMEAEYKRALSEREYFEATIAGFRLTLQDGLDRKILLLSDR